jgi:hypothetical protein
MSAIKLLCHLAEVNPSIFSRDENLILEADLFIHICEELKKIYKIQSKDYFRIMKFNAEMENAMIETNFVRGVLNDILSTEEYSLPGVAQYTYAPEDVIYEIATGKNTDPSASLLRKIIELHRSVRPNLYRDIVKKIMDENIMRYT